MTDLGHMIGRNRSQPVQCGAFASFPNLESLARGFTSIAEFLTAFDMSEHKRRHGPEAEPPNVLNFALRIFQSSDDKEENSWAEHITILVNGHADQLLKRGVRRVCIVVCRPGVYPFYYTLCPRTDGSWGEEQAIRNIEPALAFQLELSRLSHYDLTPCLGQSQQLHIYHAVARENKMDNRFFIRALVRPGRLRASMSTAEYLITETDRLMTVVLDALEVVSAQHRNADCNNIFMNFGVSFVIFFLSHLKAQSLQSSREL